MIHIEAKVQLCLVVQLSLEDFQNQMFFVIRHLNKLEKQ